MYKLVKFATFLTGLMVVVLYWFDWNLCEKNNANFDLSFWNSYVVFIGYAFFVYTYVNKTTKESSSVMMSISASIIYGVLIGAYKTEGAVCGTTGEGMSKYYYYNTETFLPFVINNISLGLYAFLCLWPISKKTNSEHSGGRSMKDSSESVSNRPIQSNDSHIQDDEKEVSKLQETNLKPISRDALVHFYNENASILLSPAQVLEIASKTFTLSDFGGFNKEKVIEIVENGEMIFAFPEGIIVCSSSFCVYDNGFKPKYTIFPLKDFVKISANNKTAFSYGRLKINGIEVKKEGYEKFKIDLYEKLKKVLVEFYD
jgi:hypothetical protein